MLQSSIHQATVILGAETNLPNDRPSKEVFLMGRIGSEYGPQFLIMCELLGLYPHDCDHCNERAYPLCTCGPKMRKGILEWCGEDE